MIYKKYNGSILAAPTTRLCIIIIMIIVIIIMIIITIIITIILMVIIMTGKNVT